MLLRNTAVVRILSNMRRVRGKRDPPCRRFSKEINTEIENLPSRCSQIFKMMAEIKGEMPYPRGVIRVDSSGQGSG
jgi:hypothetical protein